MPNPAHVDYGVLLDATAARYNMAVRLNCHPMTINLLRNAYDTAAAVWRVQQAMCPGPTAPDEDLDVPPQETDYLRSGNETTGYLPSEGTVPWPG